jgi:hypothetical protein
VQARLEHEQRDDRGADGEQGDHIVGSDLHDA